MPFLGCFVWGGGGKVFKPEVILSMWHLNSFNSEHETPVWL